MAGSVSDSGLPYSASQDYDLELLRESDGFDRATLSRSQSLPEGSFHLDWQLPRAPVRFPLRDALMSPPGDQDFIEGSSSVSSKGPLRVKMTSKAKVLKYLSHRKRYDLDPPGLGELHAQPMPRPPPESTARKPAKKTLNTYGTELRTQARRNAEGAGWMTWMPQEEKQETAAPQTAQIRGTLTSSARAVLSHSRRFAAQESIAEQAAQSSAHASTGMSKSTSGHSTGGHAPAKKSAPDPMASWSPSRQSRGLPKPVKEWVCKGLEFTDGGLGIGDRFDTVIQKMADRAPGHIYEQDYGNIGRYRSEASIPTKQPEGRHHSTETHRMGARRDTTGKRDRQRPGPGTYEFRGFAQELVHKLSKRPKGEAPKSLSPPCTPKHSQQAAA